MRTAPILLTLSTIGAILCAFSGPFLGLYLNGPIINAGIGEHLFFMLFYIVLSLMFSLGIGAPFRLFLKEHQSAWVATILPFLCSIALVSILFNQGATGFALVMSMAAAFLGAMHYIFVAYSED